jgi:cardiolipin synthase
VLAPDAVTIADVGDILSFARAALAGDGTGERWRPSATEPERERVSDAEVLFELRDNRGRRTSIEREYRRAIREARREIIIANAYFFPGLPFRRALTAAAGRGVRVTLLLQARVEYVLLRFASRALYGQLLAAGVEIQEYRKSFLHAKVAVVDGRWATVGSSNIDPYSLLMAREANIVVRDRDFAGELRTELTAMIAGGARRIARRDWTRRPRVYKALVWTAYGFVRLAMGLLGYGGNEWWGPRRPRARAAVERPVR